MKNFILFDDSFCCELLCIKGGQSDIENKCIFVYRKLIGYTKTIKLIFSKK